MKTRVASWLFLVFSVVVFAAMILVVGDYLRNRRITRDMRSSLQRIDRLIQDRRYLDADTALLRAADHAGSASSWFRLIRRSWEVAVVTDRYQTFGEISGRAATSLPGNRELQALALYGDMQNGRVDDAARRADRYLASDERYRTLVTAAFLRTGQRLEDAQADDVAGLTLIERTSSPEQLLVAAEITGDPRFRVNAVLRAMEVGQRDIAEVLVDDVRFYRHFPLLSAFVAFDLDDIDRFFSYLQLADGPAASSDEILMMTGDLYMSDGRYNDARILYDEIMQTIRAAGQTPPAGLFLNRAWLAGNTRDSEAAWAILEKGLASHPDNWDLRRALVLELAAIDRESALRVLAEAPLEQRAGVELIEERIFSPTRQISANVARLWLLYEQYPDDETIGRYLAWFLSGLPQPTELGLLLARGNQTDSSWKTFYRGVMAVLEGNLETAYPWFVRSAREHNSWHGAVNAARIGLMLGGPAAREAAELLDLAEALNAGRPATDSDRALVAALQGAVLAERGDYVAASDAAGQALGYDGSNQHARALLRFLETR